LSDEEVANLDLARLAAMEVDRARYGVLAGIGNTIYFKQGFFVAPRVLLAIPVLAAAADSDIGFWPDFSVAIGVAL
ncbi:MAG: hypothetical protein KC656_20435, partial [Myxococcales bacterium]|nr:hypothetical protein [Myxococcales bacterium]